MDEATTTDGADTNGSKSACGGAYGTSSIDSLLHELQLERSYLDHLASKRPTPLKLKDMYDYGSNPHTRLINAQFLYRELPVRIAHRAMDLLTLPHGLSQAAPIQQVARIYLGFLKRMQDFPYPETRQQEALFTDMLQAFILDRSTIPVSIAQGVNAWWQKANTEVNCDIQLQEMEDALERFFTARVGLRFVTEHYVLSSPRREAADAFRRLASMFPVSEGSNDGDSDDDGDGDGGGSTVGCIQANCNVTREIRRVADLVSEQTKEYYGGLCPEIDIVDCSRSDGQPFTFVPQHLHYVFAELLKNSCRASVRRYKEAVEDGQAHPEIPAIRVILVKGEEDVTIKVADKGGGIPRSLMATIWKFAHSTASEDEVDTEFGRDVASGAKIRGFGLPLARIYARYFGGELTLKSTEGYGVDAYLHLPRLGQACENLPLRVRDSPGERDSTPVSMAAAASGSAATASSAKGDGKRFFSSVPLPGLVSRQSKPEQHHTTADCRCSVKC
jgi:pyruvate dehydrogenase kinase 2/3/4